MIEEIRHGTDAAWRQLIFRYQGRLLAYARSRLSAGPDAEDAVQEAFIGLLQSLVHYDGRRSLETYLFGILRNKILDVCRQRHLRPTVSFEDQRDQADVHRVGGETPSGVLRQKEATDAQKRALAESLARLIATLRDQDKLADLQVIELIFFAGWRNKHVAAALNMNEKAVAGVKFRAVARLRAFLEERPGSSGLFSDVDDLAMNSSVASVWQARRLTCLKRSTLGAYLLGIVDEAWDAYIRFHLETLACPFCKANLADLRAEQDEQKTRHIEERMFASSVGFLSGPSSPG